MKRGRWALVVVASALLGAALVLGLAQRPAAQPAAAVLQWRAGTAQRYDVRVDSEMKIEVGSSASRMGVSVAGVLDTFTIAKDGASATLGMRLSDVDLRVEGQSDGDMNRALGEPFRVRFDAAGMPQAFEFPAGVNARNRLILENLVRMFQVTLQPGQGWESGEANASGSYTAVYRRDGANQVHKSKRGFVAHASSPTYAGAQIQSSEHLRFDRRFDWLTGMQVEETIHTPGQGGPGMRITNRASLALRPADRPVARAGEGPGMWQFTAAAAPAPQSAQAMASETTRPRISAAQASRALLDTLATLDGAHSGRLALVHRLRDLLRVDDQLPSALLQAMQEQQLTDRTRADLYLALELAGTASAQAALMSVAMDPAASLQDGMRALVALGGVRQPSGEVPAVLSGMALAVPATHHDLHMASTATYSLGNVGRTLNEAGDPGYSTVRAVLLANAMGGSDATQRATFVHAIGNTRDASLVPQIIGLLDAPEAGVRRAAALSIGMLDTDQAAGHLMQRFITEPDSAVRAAIAESLVSWSAPSAAASEAMRARMQGEQDENARYHMARFLGANADRFPENRAALQALLRSEQSQRIRQEVAEALASGE